MSTKPGEISSDLLRGVRTYSCTCGSMMLRPYRIEHEEEGTILCFIVCLGCGATTDHRWQDQPPAHEWTPDINGETDPKYKQGDEDE